MSKCKKCSDDVLKCSYDEKIKGYNNGLVACASFLSSGRSFENWYGDGPSEICPGWLELLESLGRQKEYYDLKDKFCR